MKDDRKSITIELEGRKIKVPEGLTVIEALWDTGHDVKRGVGCLSGLCGACTVAYLAKESKKVKFGLGCQKVVEEGLNVIMMPYFPSRVAHYLLERMETPLEQLQDIYPELYTCNDCMACNICPEWINVAGVMKAAKGADYETATEHIMDCIMCGLCASRCPKGIAPQNVALFIQRALAKERTFPPNLQQRIAEIESFQFGAEWEKIAAMGNEALEAHCRQREGA
ncbi:2Fe-2S iron-sulfur cluster-binding protein [Geobacter sp.]|uniref:2Fe-2S iron-sulfur cluster-binding protein n=1 Tax=Geobacter sp. TaxID=46610 RepID=UPI0027B969E7|nr:2Fe-2S iron-sulfur cluster-binding protein [Geobacter sp.]